MILCCGEALIDMIPQTTQSGALGYVPHCGGSVFNTAIAIGRLGVKSGFLSGLSSDFFGDQLRETLTASAVDSSLSVTSDRPTTLAFVRLANGQASYAFYDENTAGRMLDEKNFGPIPDDVEAMFFGGISLVNEPCGRAYAALAEREVPRHTIMLDPNIRTSFISDETIYRARLEQLFNIADIVKVSHEDLCWIMNDDRSLEDKAKHLLGLGPSIVLLTEGRKGTTAFSRGGAQFFVPASRVDVVDSVGAGDTFNAGVLAKLAEYQLLSKERIGGIDREILESAVQFGSSAAAICVARAGANPPWLSEMNEIIT